MDESAWTILESKVEYETGWYDGGYDLLEQPDGSTKRYYWADLPPAVVVVPIIDDEVVFIEQYRPTVKTRCLELPAGIVEDGESYVEAGRRELVEETGYTADSIKPLQQVDVATGVLRHERGYTVATGLSGGSVDLDENEFLSVRTIPRSDSIAAARELPANDATLQALLLAREDGYL